jgi:hypothetical protein
MVIVPINHDVGAKLVEHAPGLQHMRRCPEVATMRA